jgi:hypothetical protein
VTQEKERGKRHYNTTRIGRLVSSRFYRVCHAANEGYRTLLNFIPKVAASEREKASIRMKLKELKKTLNNFGKVEMDRSKEMEQRS